MSGGREHKKAGGQAAESAGADVAGGIDPRLVAAQRRIRAARAHNEQHPDLVEKFNHATGGVAANGVRAIMIWQSEHGIKPADGKIGPHTVQAAEAAGNKGEAQQEGTGGPQAPAPGADAPGHAKAPHHAQDKPQATIKAEPAEEGSGLAGELVAGGVTTGEESREKEDPEEMKKEGGATVSEAAGSAGEAIGAEEKLEHVKGGGAGLKVAAQIARLPHVIHLVKAGKYEEAVSYIRDGLAYSDYIEVIKLVAEHSGIELAEIATKVPWLFKMGKAVAIGAETADIVLVGIQFQFDALKALQKAHEEGERDNRIYLYATAWAHSFLWGSYSNPGAIDEKQIEAVANGVRDGKATAGNCGEKAEQIGRQLLQQYGDPKNAERALMDALIKRAGIEGIKFHEGK